MAAIDDQDTATATSHSLSSQPLPPPRDESEDNASLLSAITYPVSYTLSGLLRRLSTDEAPTALAKALSANYNGSMNNVSHGAFGLQPPKRHLSPFQPPALTPLAFHSLHDASERLLNKSLAEEIRLLVPPRMQLVDNWTLVYSLEQHGSSLGSLYNLCSGFPSKRGGFVLVVRDGSGMIFGAYLSDPPKPCPNYYGTGECFLWRATKLPDFPDLSSLPPPPSEDTTHAQRFTTIGLDLSNESSSDSLIDLDDPSEPSVQTDGRAVPAVSPSTHSHRRPSHADERVRFQAFPYVGENDYTIFCTAEFLSLGGGNGKYGLWLDDRLARGVSATVPTYLNENLSDDGEKFDVLGVEMWHIGV